GVSGLRRGTSHSSVTMIRVGYPATLDGEPLRVSEEIELVPLADGLDHEIEVDVWVPDPYPTRALRIWSHLRGVRLVLSLMAGTDWITPIVGADVTVCNARGAHSVSTAEWVVSAVLAMLKQFPLFLDVQRAGDWRRRREAAEEYERQTGDTRRLHPAAMVEELTGKRVLLVGYGTIAREIERLLEPFGVDMVRVARHTQS